MLFLIGFCMRKVYITGFQCNFRKCLPWITFCIGIILAGFSALNLHAGAQANRLNSMHPAMFMIFLLGIFFVFSLSLQIENSCIGRLFAFIGDFSFTIMMLHFVGFKLVTIFSSLFLPAVDISSFPTDRNHLHLLWALYLLVGIGFPILTNRIYSYAKKGRSRHSCV